MRIWPTESLRGLFATQNSEIGITGTSGLKNKRAVLFWFEQFVYRFERIIVFMYISYCILWNKFAVATRISLNKTLFLWCQRIFAYQFFFLFWNSMKREYFLNGYLEYSIYHHRIIRMWGARKVLRQLGDWIICLWCFVEYCVYFSNLPKAVSKTAVSRITCSVCTMDFRMSPPSKIRRTDDIGLMSPGDFIYPACLTDAIIERGGQQGKGKKGEGDMHFPLVLAIAQRYSLYWNIFAKLKKPKKNICRRHYTLRIRRCVRTWRRRSKLSHCGNEWSASVSNHF